MSPEEYIAQVGARLRADGADVTDVQFSEGPALVGHRSEFRLSWLATKLHLFTVVVHQPVVGAAALEAFANEALSYADSRKGSLRGLQNGVAALPVMVTGQADDDAVALAEGKIVRRFAAFAWPTVVDLGSGRVHRHEGRVVVGGIYAGWMRQQTDVALPPLDPRPTTGADA